MELGLGRAAAIDGLRGLGRALETVATLKLLCDPRDIGQTLEHAGDGRGGEGFDPTLFLFDNVPGGVGLAERIHESADELLARARMLIVNCGCNEGCPSCVGATAEDGGIRKRAAAAMGLLLAHA